MIPWIRVIQSSGYQFSTGPKFRSKKQCWLIGPFSRIETHLWTVFFNKTKQKAKQNVPPGFFWFKCWLKEKKLHLHDRNYPKTRWTTSVFELPLEILPVLWSFQKFPQKIPLKLSIGCLKFSIFRAELPRNKISHGHHVAGSICLLVGVFWKTFC